MTEDNKRHWWMLALRGILALLFEMLPFGGVRMAHALLLFC
jgi:hypothetical protein